MLDYVAVDYGGAVEDGKVVSTSEYAEMVEFTETARFRIEQLEQTAGKQALVSEVEELRDAVAAKQPHSVVAGIARRVASDLLRVYRIPITPSKAPDRQRGAELYAQQCASCHGLSGDGAGPAAAALKPPPVAFSDKARARDRSIFALYQVIEQGIDGTSMASFAALPSDDRWSLALYVGAFAFPEKEASSGERIWRDDANLRAQIGPEQLIAATPASLGDLVGIEKADAVVAYIRRNPSAIFPAGDGSLALAHSRIAEALSAYSAGDRSRATSLALSAYLDGFEPIEPLLAARNNRLLVQVESAMAELRAGIQGSAPPAEVQQRAAAVIELFGQVERELDTSASSAAASFAGAFSILFREGLEALLIVTAMVAFLRKANKGDVLRYVHAGWVGALLAGLATWLVATSVLSVSGASRELTEGFGSLLAGMVLLWVGIWMHGKSQADAWQRYIRETMNRALGRKSAWFLFGLSFLVVYREVFETILFYAAIWDQGQGHAVIAGAGLAIIGLALVAALLLRYSRRLPIGKFFAYSSFLMAILAVVLIGKSVSALQEAGYMRLDPLPVVPRIDFLGVFPTIEGVASQLVMCALLIAGFAYNRRTTRPHG